MNPYSKKTRILQLVENLDDSYGGPAKSVPNLAASISDYFDQTLISLEFSDQENNEVITQNKLDWKVFEISFFKKFRISISLLLYLIKSRKNYDILHAHNLWNYIPIITTIVGKLTKKKIIFSPRGSLYPWSLNQNRIVKRIAWKLYQKRILNLADCIHVTEKDEFKQIRNLGIKSPISLVPNGINLSEFIQLDKGVAKKFLGLDHKKKYILFLSRIHKKKGVTNLVRAVYELKNKFDSYELLIIGPGIETDYGKSVIDLIQDLDLDELISVRGMVTGDERKAFFQAADFFILPSYTENFGIVIAEALANKLPVITTKGTPWEEIEIHQAGWWLDNNSAKLIAQTLQEAISLSDHDRELMRNRAITIAKEYDWEKLSRTYVDMYNSIIDHR